MDSTSEIFPEVTLSDYDEVMLSDEERPSTPKQAPEECKVEPSRTADNTQDVPNPANVSAAMANPDPSPLVAVTTVATLVTAPGSAASAKTAPTKPNQCRLCPKQHTLFRCMVFRKMPMDRRLRTVVAHQYCFNCLRADHQARSCTNPHRCQWCNERHHTLLHSRSRSSHAPKAPATSVPPSPRQTEPGPPPALAPGTPLSLSSPSAFPVHTAPISRLPIGRIISLAPTLIVRLCLTHSNIPVRALLDPCCRGSQICESLVNQVQWPVSILNDFAYCDFMISSSYDDSKRQYVTAKVAKLTCGVTPAISVPLETRESFRGLELADPTFYRSGAVAIVLGPEIYARIIEARVITQPGLPTAQYTSFGWVISGPVPL